MNLDTSMLLCNDQLQLFKNSIRNNMTFRVGFGCFSQALSQSEFTSHFRSG